MVRFTLRLTAGMHRKLKQRAKRNLRSLHAEIIYILGKALDEDNK